MNQNLKKRIESINKGIIPEGYKKTKVGIFPQDWKEEKIGELFYKVMERNNGQFDETKWISVAKMYYQEPEKVTSNNIDTRTYVMRLGDMAFEGHPNKDFLFGRFVVNDLGDGIISELFPIYRHRKQYVTNYWKYAIQFESIMARIYIRCITMSGASSNKINDDEFKKESLFLPPLPEQQKIAEILGTQDKLIELQERKINQLKTLKKGYLQKMFPKKGCKYPELRFKGFTDAWEQRELDYLCELITVGIANSATHAYVDDGIVMFRNQNIKENVLDDSDLIHINKDFELKYENKRLKENDLLIARTGYPGTACVVPKKYEGSQTFTTLIARLKKEVNPYYVCQYLNSDYGKDYFSSTQIGGGQKNSGAGILEKFPLKYPTNIDEQNSLSGFFMSFDNLITLHQRKLDEEKQKKKALMQLLLTGKVRCI